MSIRWLRNVLIEGEKSTIEIQIGDRRIGDKCYTRINEDTEVWFENIYNTRGDIIAQGIDILKKRLANKNITTPDGNPYDWQ
ncbi:MAG: hypothetical protein FWE57_02855 [Chitinispirillia bacterium]|nr:hypothetical protein [Chitinispirillia bacterium]